MQQQLKNRLEALKKEFETGQKKLHELENETTALRHMLLRISGAAQVLEEELEKNTAPQNGQKPTAEPVENHS
jgi:predicted nuclease with TOPRIM domain